MKKYISVLKITVCILLAALSVFAVSCSEKMDEYALYGTDSEGKNNVNARMTEGMFSYYLSQQKADYLTVLALNYPDFSGSADEIWGLSAPDGTSYEKHFFEAVITDAKRIVAANTALFETQTADGKQYTLPEEYLEYIDSTIESFAIKEHGSVMNFENYLAKFGATYEDYKNLYVMTLNVDLMKELLFNDQTGALRVTEREKQIYYAENYYTVEHIFITTEYQEKIDGTRAPLSDEERARRTAVADEIYGKIAQGASLGEISELYKKDYIVVYPEPAAMDKTGESSSAPELGEALKKLEIGESQKVVSDYGVHVIRRIETDPAKYNSNATVLEAIRSKLVNKYFEEFVMTYNDNVTVNENVVGLHSMKAAPIP